MSCFVSFLSDAPSPGIFDTWCMWRETENVERLTAFLAPVGLPAQMCGAGKKHITLFISDFKLSPVAIVLHYHGPLKPGRKVEIRRHLQFLKVKVRNT